MTSKFKTKNIALNMTRNLESTKNLLKSKSKN